MIEEFFKAHQYTIAALSALGTLAAVVTSEALSAADGLPRSWRLRCPRRQGAHPHQEFGRLAAGAEQQDEVSLAALVAA
jgi:hypothetical protein